MRLSKRLNLFNEYFFEKANQKIREYEKQTGIKAINLGIGSPDLAPTEEIINRLIEEAKKPSNHKYASYSGLQELRESIAKYYKRRFGVELIFEKEVLPLIGSKEGLANLHFAIIDEGDEVLIPDPGYPVYTSGTLMAGGKPVYYDLLEENNFLPNIDQLEKLVNERTKMIWLNYPNNPTGATATKEDLAKILAFAEKHDLIIANDNPYSDVTFDGYKAPSILEVTGAKHRTIEFNSLSKTYNMAGWRIGMAVGGEELISALLKIKSNIDTGIFLPLQYAAITAFGTEDKWIEERNKVYQERRDLLMEILKDIGLRPIQPKAALYIWAKSECKDVEKESFEILSRTGVFLTPGTVYGKNGEGYFRVSLCQPVEVIEEAKRRLIPSPLN